MRDKPKIAKGGGLEELLRAYFLRAGFFVVRGVPFRFADEDLTDVDLWLYERPMGTSRRIEICDMKCKVRPKTIERIFWTRGLADALNVDGAYVATTDRRTNLRSVAKRLNLHLIDGTDIERIRGSQSVSFDDRLSDEELIASLKTIDTAARNKDLQEARIDIISALSDGFGAASAVRSLEEFGRLAARAVTYHPGSDASRAAGRLAYLAAAIACASLDYVSVGAAFRSLDERRERILQAVRWGALSDEAGQNSYKLALALIEKYGQAGKATARAVEAGVNHELKQIPAEIIADQAMRMMKSDQLFVTGRDLEMASYRVHLPSFDELNTPAKSMLGAMLDYSAVDRQQFAQAWSAVITNDKPEQETGQNALNTSTEQQDLFSVKK